MEQVLRGTCVPSPTLFVPPARVSTLVLFVRARVHTRDFVIKQRQVKTKYCVVHVLGVSAENKFRVLLVLRSSEIKSWFGGHNYSSQDQELSAVEVRTTKFDPPTALTIIYITFYSFVDTGDDVLPWRLTKEATTNVESRIENIVYPYPHGIDGC